MDIVLLFPGQGSQKPGMGRDLADAHAAARDTFAAVDGALGSPLSTLMFEGPADELTRTHNAQPALLAHGAALWAILRERLAPHVRAAAGHSLGEFTAYHAAGALPLEAAVRLVRRRGELMLEAGERRPGTMAAILGHTSEPVERLCERASAESGLVVPANFNDTEQVVVSGEVAGVQKAMELAKGAGAKLAKQLQVSGAFHSPLMAVAQPGLAEALDAAAPGAPAFPVYSNVTAEPVTDGGTARELLLRQLTSPVRWLDLVQALAGRFPGATFVELGPGNVLGKLVKRIAPSVRTVQCGTAAELDTFVAELG
jgi:[acyl-carrier-protein] S-malonyltransferase